MVYQSWSVVFGEQPSAAKWNILGTNDSHFNDLIGLVGTDTVLNNIPYQANVTNSVRDSVLIQHGYGAIVPGVAAFGEEAVTFPTAYDSIPIVIGAYGGDNTGTTTTLGDGTIAVKARATSAFHTVLTTGFTARISSGDGTNYGSDDSVFYHWLSIGINT